MAKSKKSKQKQATQQAQRRATKVERRSVEAGHPKPLTERSRHQAPAAWQSRGLPEDKRGHAIELFNELDGMSAIRNGLRRVAADMEQWAGIPMPLPELTMTIEPSFPRAAELMAIGSMKAASATAVEEESTDGDLAPEKSKITIRNKFWSWRYRSDVIVWEQDGKISWRTVGQGSQIDILLNTLGASDAWGIEQEGKAVDLLGTLVRHRQFKQYLLTGSFMEKSERSGVHYLFRRLRPTLAIGTHSTGKMTILCALCLHSIGFYNNSWAGAMCPTDEIIAHLMLMRGDEHMYWKRSNQHPPRNAKLCGI